MPSSFSGSFPGGPSRKAERQPLGRSPRLQRVQDLEERVAQRSMLLKKGARRSRVVWGVTSSAVAAAVVGLVLGLMSHSSAEELRMADERQNTAPELSREVNRTLLQLWKMEDLEAARASGMSR